MSAGERGAVGVRAERVSFVPGEYLYIASYEGDLPEVERLLKRGASVRWSNTVPRTPNHPPPPNSPPPVSSGLGDRAPVCVYRGWVRPPQRCLSGNASCM